MNYNATNDSHPPYNQTYLSKLTDVTHLALERHRRTMAVTLILRLPEYRDIGDTLQCLPNIEQGLMSRFIESLKAKIQALKTRKEKQGLRVHSSSLHYAWVRELSQDSKPHYHAVLFVNNDTFASLGHFTREGDNLGSLIQEAWCSALAMQSASEYHTLVHFPQNPLYYLNINASDFEKVHNSLMCRLRYFAKERSKVYSRVERSFGCSQRR
ncbi:inovirus Gp2 family protein [Ewingella americana]|uniref:Inovirus Gp2 family protein n=1 Tax=Ewingella americana TaxID=41202 RepID=A0A502GQ68_9GAMM|nr:inovirus Gp2 family protein [Ewingella americana]TPG63136.1 inovirus Gp2 family protein [Ewingella americana]